MNLFKQTLKLLLVITTFFIGISSSLATNISDEFTYNEAKIEAEFNALNSLEKVIQNNLDQADYAFVSTNYTVALQPVSTHLNLNTSMPLDSDKNPILGIPSFLWGCGLGVIGIVAVAVIGDDLPKAERQAQVKKSAVGCLVGYGAAALLYFVVLGGALAAA